MKKADLYVKMVKAGLWFTGINPTHQGWMRLNIVMPALVLFFLSPVIGELLSGAAPPAEFFNPLGFVMLSVLYGGGAIIVRELTQRWGKGWVTLFVLGSAYGIAEEGLMCKSFFDPKWMDLGALKSYGRWLDVNWVWSLELTIYHAVFSITIPIVLVGLIFPARRQQPWISRWKLCALFGLWVFNAVIIFLFISPYRPPVVHYLLTLAVVIALCISARRLPQSMVVSHYAKRQKPAHPFWFLQTGFSGTLFFFIMLVWILPNTSIPPIITMLLMAGLAILVGWGVLKMSGSGIAWSNKHQLALVSGALGFFILLAPLQELDKNRPDNTTGMTIVGLAMAIFLFWLAWRVRRTKILLK